jgi:hypothetical protein
MAERFAETINIRPVSTGTGAAEGLLSISDELQSFKRDMQERNRQEAIARGKATAQATSLGRDEQGITKAPELEKPAFIGSIEIAAHNKALRASYLASLDSDIRNNVSRIKAENPDNLTRFNDQVAGFAKGVISSADGEVRNLVANTLNQRVASARASVQAADIKRQNDALSEDLKQYESETIDSMLVAARGGDVQGSEREFAALSVSLDDQVNAGFITPAEAREKKRSASVRKTHESIIGATRELAENGQFDDLLNGISRARKQAPKGMSVQEHDDLLKAMMAEVNISLSIKDKLEADEEKVVKESQDLNYSKSFVGITNGQITTGDIISDLESGKIDSSQFRSLLNVLNTRGQGIDDHSLIREITADIDEGVPASQIKLSIISASGVRLTEKTANDLLQDLNDSLDSESILKTSEVKRARDFLKPNIRVTGVLGALDPEAERRLARSQRDFDERVKAGEDPWRVADELVGKEDFRRARTPTHGTKDDLKSALENLKAARIGGQIDDDEYNDQFQLIQQLQATKQTIDSFDAARKEATANAPR